MKIQICVPVYNRKKITELVLENLSEFKEDSDDLFVYNDWSDEYDNEFLEPLCDKVIKLDKSDKRVIKNERNVNGMGVQHLRWHQFRSFLDSDYDLIYMTDSDAFHDTNFRKVLLDVYNKFTLSNGNKMPVCLYNTKWHSQPNNLIKETKDVLMRKTIPGVSQLYDKAMVEKIVNKLNTLDKDPEYAWDYECLKYLSLPTITTKTSYVEHFGASVDSMHTPEGLWDRDRALNPTQYLSNIREGVIDYLENREEKPIW